MNDTYINDDYTPPAAPAAVKSSSITTKLHRPEDSCNAEPVVIELATDSDEHKAALVDGWVEYEAKSE
jgi:hypothetical protein